MCIIIAVVIIELIFVIAGPQATVIADFTAGAGRNLANYLLLITGGNSYSF